MNESGRMKLAELTTQLNLINTEIGTLVCPDDNNHLMIKALARLTEVEYLIGQALNNLAIKPAA